MEYIKGIVGGILFGVVIAGVTLIHPAIALGIGIVAFLFGLFYLIYNNWETIGTGFLVVGIIVFGAGVWQLTSQKINFIGYILKPFYSLYYYFS